MTQEQKIMASYRQAAKKEIELDLAEKELAEAKAKRDLAHRAFVDAKDKLQLRQWKVDDVFFEETVTPIPA